MKMLDLIGYIGALLALAAFFQTSKGKWHGQSVKYQVTNLAAGIILLYYAWAKHAYANILLNAIWSVVAIYGLYTAGTIARRKLDKGKRGT